MSRIDRRACSGAVLLCAVAATGCFSVGPKTLPRDRFEYSAAIGESWKRQTLLNIIKLRYMDPPLFLDVGQIVSGYQLETAVNAGTQLSVDNGDVLNFGAGGRFIDRPTITYVPLTGNKFIKGLMTPLPPDAVFFTIQSGLPADGVLSLTLSSINGLKNQATSPTGVSPAEPEFLEALTLLRRIQLSGASTMRVLQSPDKTSTSVMTFRAKDMPDDVRSDITELRRLLKLDPQAAEFNLAFGSAAANDRELAVLTRSLLQIMMLLAVQVDVPPTDLSEGRVVPGWESLPEGAATRWFQVHSATDKPASAFTAVQYRDHWFWVDDTDLRSKRVLSFILLLFTLADTGERESLPLITIPAQ